MSIPVICATGGVEIILPHKVFYRISGQEYLLVVDTGSADLVRRRTIFIPSMVLTDPAVLPWSAYDIVDRVL